MYATVEDSNIIRYAVFGMPRLLEIIRAINVDNYDDPIGDFLQRSRILFNPEMQSDTVDVIKVEIDTILAMRKLKTKGLSEVDKNIVRTLVATIRKFKFNEQLIKRLQEIRGKNQNPNEYLLKLSLTGGLPPDADSNSLRPHLDKVGAIWIETAERFLNEPEGIRTIDFNIVKEIGKLTSKIMEMKHFGK